MFRTESSPLPRRPSSAARRAPFVVAAWLLWCGIAGAGLGVVHGCCEVLWPALLVFLGAACCARALADVVGGRACVTAIVVAAVAAVAGMGIVRNGTWPGPAELLAGAVAIGAAFGLVTAAASPPRTVLGEFAIACAGGLLAAVAARGAPLAWHWLGPQWVAAAPLFGVLLLLLLAPRAVDVVRCQPLDRVAGVSALLALVGLTSWGADDANALPWRVAPAVMLLRSAALPSRRGVAFGVIAAVVAMPVIVGSAALPARYTTLQRDGRAAVVYDRATQELQLRWDDVVVDGAGPDRALPELLATLSRAALHPADRVLLVGSGAARWPAAFATAGLGEVDVLRVRQVAPALLARLQLDGPVPLPGEVDGGPWPSAQDRPWRAALQRLPAGSRQAIVVGEPLHELATAMVTVEVQRELRRVVGAGLLLQPFWLDRVPVARLQALLGAAAATHPWNGVFAVGDNAVLVSAAAPPDFAKGGAWSDWPEAARWQSHRAHLGDAADVNLARLITVDAAAAAVWAVSEFDALPAVGAVDRGEVLASLVRLQQPPTDGSTPSPPVADGLFATWSRTEAQTRRLVATIRNLNGDAEGMASARARAQALAATSLPRGAPRAELQAALGLPGADGLPLLEPSAAALRAQAIDPTLFESIPLIFADLPRPKSGTGDLEDLARLPAPERLAELASGTGKFAVALRARFPTDCARALLMRLQVGPLGDDASAALRELADPFVLAEAGRIVGTPARRAELLAWWRGDLAMPAALSPLVVEAPLRLAAALPRRRDARALAALADLLLADDVEVRVAAAAALRDGPGAAIAYDPQGPAEQRIDAASRLRSLHNRAP